MSKNPNNPILKICRLPHCHDSGDACPISHEKTPSGNMPSFLREPLSSPSIGLEQTLIKLNEKMKDAQLLFGRNS
jgi:hypothetical protein